MMMPKIAHYSVFALIRIEKILELSTTLKPVINPALEEVVYNNPVVCEA